MNPEAAKSEVDALFEVLPKFSGAPSGGRRTPGGPFFRQVAGGGSDESLTEESFRHQDRRPDSGAPPARNTALLDDLASPKGLELIHMHCEDLHRRRWVQERRGRL